METDSFKIVFYSDMDFTFMVARRDGNLFLHCEVDRWRLSILKRMYREFARFCAYASSPFYTVTPNPKFAKLFGGEVVGHFVHDGITYEVIKWDLK